MMIFKKLLLCMLIALWSTQILAMEDPTSEELGKIIKRSSQADAVRKVQIFGQTTPMYVVFDADGVTPMGIVKMTEHNLGPYQHARELLRRVGAQDILSKSVVSRSLDVFVYRAFDFRYEGDVFFDLKKFLEHLKIDEDTFNNLPWQSRKLSGPPGEVHIGIQNVLLYPHKFCVFSSIEDDNKRIVGRELVRLLEEGYEDEVYYIVNLRRVEERRIHSGLVQRFENCLPHESAYDETVANMEALFKRKRNKYGGFSLLELSTCSPEEQTQVLSHVAVEDVENEFLMLALTGSHDLTNRNYMLILGEDNRVHLRLVDFEGFFMMPDQGAIFLRLRHSIFPIRLEFRERLLRINAEKVFEGVLDKDSYLEAQWHRASIALFKRIQDGVSRSSTVSMMELAINLSQEVYGSQETHYFASKLRWWMIENREYLIGVINGTGRHAYVPIDFSGQAVSSTLFTSYLPRGNY